MFKKKKDLRYLALGALLLSVFGLIVSYVAMSTALNIEEANNIWKINIVDVSVETKGDVSSTNPKVILTSLNDLNINFNGNGSIIYKFKVKNSGGVDAVVRNINFSKICTSNECENISYKLSYLDGRDVLDGDVVNFGTSMEMLLEVSYKGNGVSLEEVDFIMLYEQA